MDSKKIIDTDADLKDNRKQYPLKSDKFINTDLKRNYQNFIESDVDLPNWPTQEEINVKKLKKIKKITPHSSLIPNTLKYFKIKK